MQFLWLFCVLPGILTGATVGCSESTGASNCCRVCTEGRARGDSCIPQNSTCNVGPGCACND